MLSPQLSGERFKRLYKTLNLNQGSTTLYFQNTRPTIQKWCELGPNYTMPQRQMLISDGVNPLYCDGYGEMTLPGVTIDQAIDNVQKRISINLDLLQSEVTNETV